MKSLVLALFLTSIQASAMMTCALSKESSTQPGKFTQVLYRGVVDESKNPTIVITQQGNVFNMEEKYPTAPSTPDQLARYKKDIAGSLFFAIAEGSIIAASAGPNLRVQTEFVLQSASSNQITPVNMTAIWSAKHLQLLCESAAN